MPGQGLRDVFHFCGTRKSGCPILANSLSRWASHWFFFVTEYFVAPLQIANVHARNLQRVHARNAQQSLDRFYAGVGFGTRCKVLPPKPVMPGRSVIAPRRCRPAALLSRSHCFCSGIGLDTRCKVLLPKLMMPGRLVLAPRRCMAAELPHSHASFVRSSWTASLDFLLSVSITVLVRLFFEDGKAVRSF